MDIYVKAPAQKTTIADLGGDGKGGHDLQRHADAWGSGPPVAYPVPVIPRQALELDGREDGRPPGLSPTTSRTLTHCPAGFPEQEINKKVVQEFAGTVGKTPVKFYFDKTTGLLVRVTRFTDTIIGTVPTRIELSDYRRIPSLGIKTPHGDRQHVDGRSVEELTGLARSRQMALSTHRSSTSRLHRPSKRHRSKRKGPGPNAAVPFSF